MATTQEEISLRTNNTQEQGVNNDGGVDVASDPIDTTNTTQEAGNTSEQNDLSEEPGKK